MSDGNLKPAKDEIDPEQLLELELMRARSEWAQTKARRNNLRMLSFLFLFLVVIGALFAFFIFFSPGRLSELKDEARSGQTEPSPSPR